MLNVYSLTEKKARLNRLFVAGSLFKIISIVIRISCK